MLDRWRLLIRYLKVDVFHMNIHNTVGALYLIIMKGFHDCPHVISQMPYNRVCYCSSHLLLRPYLQCRRVIIYGRDIILKHNCQLRKKLERSYVTQWGSSLLRLSVVNGLQRQLTG